MGAIYETEAGNISMPHAHQDYQRLQLLWGGTSKISGMLTGRLLTSIADRDLAAQIASGEMDKINSRDMTTYTRPRGEDDTKYFRLAAQHHLSDTIMNHRHDIIETY